MIDLSVDTLLDVLEILGITTSEFFCPTLEPKDLVILEKLGKLTDSNKQTIIDLIDNLNK